MPSPYDYHWRSVTRPEALLAAGGRFERGVSPDNKPQGKYIGGARCERCKWVEQQLGGGRPKKRSRIEIAHLDGDPWNNDPDNRAVLCTSCHRAHDYESWARKCRETRGGKKDLARPLLQEAIA